MAWEKRPDLERLCWTVRALLGRLIQGGHHTNLHARQNLGVGLEGQHLLGTGQHDTAPLGPVVAPSVVQDVFSGQTQALRNAQHLIFGQWAAAPQRGCGKGQPLTVAPNAHQADGTFLHHL